MTAPHLIAILEHSRQFGSYAVKPPLEREGAKRVLNALSTAPHAPQLTELSVSGLTNAWGWYWVRLPTTMFGGDLSSLKRLFLLGCWLDFNSLEIGDNLTILEAGICSQVARERHEGIGIPTTFHEWIDVLRRCPNLTSFCLNQRYGDGSKLAPRNLIGQPLTLQYITAASLTFKFEDLETFLDHLSLPACETLLLRIHGVEFNHNFGHRVEQIVERYSKPSQLNPNLLDFFRIGWSSFGGGFWRRPVQSVTFPAPYSNPRPNLLIWLDVDAEWDFSHVSVYLTEVELGIFLLGWTPIFGSISHLAVSWPLVDLSVCVPAVNALLSHMEMLQAIVCPEPAIDGLGGSKRDSVDISFVGYKPRSGMLSERTRVTFNPTDLSLQYAALEGQDADFASLSLHGPRNENVHVI